MPPRNSLALAVVTLSGILANATVAANEGQRSNTVPVFRGALLSAGQATRARIEELRAAGTSAIVVKLDGAPQELGRQARRVAGSARRSHLALYYWIEVARCPELADAHPEWMASLQGHVEWRRFFPRAPQPADDEVVKTYPWVPILSRETFEAQLQRVRQLLFDLPQPDGVFLNDLQGAPSACGCGNPLCRWTSDYGKKRTTTPLGENAAALFVRAVRELLPDSAVIPVWTTECEEHDGVPDGLCAGVGCFRGICWQAYTAQLRPVERNSERLAVLLPYRAFQRELPIYERKAGWIHDALKSFATMPPLHGGRAIEASRLIAVLEDWNGDAADVETQIRVATDSGAAGYIVAHAKIEQSWEPKLVKWQ